MKAILLTGAAGLLLFVLSTLCLRYIMPRNRVRMLGFLFLAILPLLVWVHLTTPTDLGFLGDEAEVSNPGMDLSFALFLYFVGFFGGVLQLYNLADRGLSLRMLIDILEKPSGVITPDEMTTCYGGGQGIIWMYDKRVRDMIFNKLVRVSDGNLVLTERGFHLARIYAALRAIAHVENVDIQ